MADPFSPDEHGIPTQGKPDPQDDFPTLDPRAFLFGRYHVEREIGRGGMGVVLLARDSKLGHAVAIKMVPDLVVKDTEAINDLRKEVLRGMALMHPGIVRTHYFERDDARAAIVMEFIDGHTLSELKARQPGHCFDPEQILSWLEQLCAVLDYAHYEAKIAHRDLKPRNVMVTLAGKVKVADFGVAASLNDSLSRVSVHNNSAGTPPYMSPQQARGATPTHLDDIYALGATVYELLTGKPPFFRGNILFQVIEQIPPTMAERRLELNVAGKPPIPPTWELAVASCLAKEPEDRPQSAGAFLAKLHGMSASSIQPPSRHSSPPPAPPRPASPPQHVPAVRVLPPSSALDVKPRSDLLPWIAGAAIAACGIAGGIYLRNHHDHPETTPHQASATPATPAAATPVPVPAATPPPVVATTTPTVAIPATKEQPYENSLGMRFVPVPITGGPTSGLEVLFSVWETRIKDYEGFARSPRREWEKREFPEVPTQPAVHISWEDATAFCAWLTEREQRSGTLPAGWSYRLPTDHEWSCAVGIGEREDAKAPPKDKDAKLAGVYPWGGQWPPPAKAGNFADNATNKAKAGYSSIPGYDDGFPYTAPVGSFPPDSLGLYDLSGNAWEWCADWYDETQKFKVLRGGAWTSGGYNFLLSSFRNVNGPIGHAPYYGFRCVLAPNSR